MIRVGHGFDVHRIAHCRKLVLGGVTVPCDFGLLGHSDADVLIHAVIDACLGALALGDIGQWFPDTDDRYRDADSSELLASVLASPALRDWELGNLDATILAEQPKLAPHVPAMRERLAALFGVASARVSVKATTLEGIGGLGRAEGIAAHAVLLLTRRDGMDTEAGT